MIARYTLFISLLLIGPAKALAQQSSSAESTLSQGTSTMQVPTSEQKTYASKGIRLGVFVPNLTLDMKMSRGNSSISDTVRAANSIGYAASYVSLPVRDLGWSTGIKYTSLVYDGSTAGVTQVDGNLGYTFNSRVYFLGGLNVSEFTNSPGEGFLKRIAPGFGWQAEVGCQLTPMFAVTGGYSWLSQSGSVNGIEINMKEFAPELGLNATF